MPKNPTCVLSVRVPESLADPIRQIAEQEYRSLNSMIVVLLSEAVSARSQAPKASADLTTGAIRRPSAPIAPESEQGPEG